MFVFIDLIGVITVPGQAVVLSHGIAPLILLVGATSVTFMLAGVTSATNSFIGGPAWPRCTMYRIPVPPVNPEPIGPNDCHCTFGWMLRGSQPPTVAPLSNDKSTP